MGKAEPRSVTPVLKMLRNVLLGRTHTSPLRFGDYYAARTQPPPEIPGGPAHQLANNYYYARDGRREISPPSVIADSSSASLRQIPSTSQGGTAGPSGLSSNPPAPGQQWKWD